MNNIESEAKRVLMNSSEYISVVEDIKREITGAQYRAAVHVNADMLLLYYDIGCIINEHKSWGNKFIDNLSSDIHMAFPESKGYSVRNLKYMAKFANTYPNREFVQQVVAQIPWGHNIVLLDKVADMDERKWYIKKSAEISKFKSAPSHFQYQNHLVWRGLHGLRQADVLVCAHKNDKKKNSQGSRCLQRLLLRGSH